jgi:hypothetical protein
VKSFADFKALLRTLWREETYRNENAKDWSSYDDIPAKECRKLIAIVKKS